MAYRILALDGGGAWSLIQVRALIAMYGEMATGRKVLQDFDLVAANSGGSLVLGGLAENLALGDLLGYFEDEARRRAIFSPTQCWGDRVLHAIAGIGPQYSAENKLAALNRLLPQRGSHPLQSVAADIRRHGSAQDVQLLVVAFDYDRNRATFFRSARTGPGWGSGEAASITLAEAIHASTNAPVNYFDRPACFPDAPGRYWDGAITGCNNPLLPAIVEAITHGKDPKAIAALSIGTGTVCLAAPGSGPDPYVRRPGVPGVMADLRKLARSILDDPPDAATFIAHAMTGGGSGVTPPCVSRIARMNPLISPVRNRAGQWSAPEGMTAEQFSYLAGLDMDAIDPLEVDAIGRFADLWLGGKVRNQPIRMDSNTLECEIGYPSYQEARAAWLAIR
jgi:uncharacterized protein